MSDISITAANVLKSTNAQSLQGVAGAGVTITAGQALFQNTDGTLGLADSNATAPANSCVGIALNGASPGQPVEYAPKDAGFTFGATILAGDVLYVSNTAGGITKTYADVASGSTVITLGTMQSTTVLNLNITVGGTKA